MKTKRIIYQCAFEVQSEILDKNERKTQVFNGLCQWMKGKYPSFKSQSQDFQSAVDWGNKDLHEFVSRRMIPDDNRSDLYYFKLEHPDSDRPKFKKWITEIGVSVVEDCVYFSLQLSTIFSEDFIGFARAEQARPPRLIRWLVSHPDLILRRGDYVVSQEPVTMASGDFEKFFGRLEDYTNGMAKVVVKGLGPKHFLVAGELSASLVGVAEVFFVSGESDEEEIAGVLADYDDTGLVVSYSHRFRRDSISVFRPGRGPGDWKNQVVYSKKLDDQRVVENVCVSLNRSGFSWLRKTLGVHCFDLADIERAFRRRESIRLGARMKEYQDRGLDRDQQDLWAELVELTNKEDRLVAVEKELEDYVEEVEKLESQLESAMNNVEFEKRMREESEVVVENVQQRNRELLESLIPMPRKFTEMPTYFNDLYPNVHYGEGACDTAGDTKGLEKIDLINVFHCLAQALPNLSGLHGPRLDSAVKVATGWDCTSSEGSMTKADNKFLKLRTFLFDDGEKLCLPHLKKREARIYFCIEQGELYVGHAGKHLDTAATRRRSHR